MKKQTLMQRFIKRYTLSGQDCSCPNGGFITPEGHIITAYGNHEAMVQIVGGTLRELIQAGVMRYHYTGGVNYPSMGIDLPAPNRIERFQLSQLLHVLKTFRPEVVVLSQVGKKKVKIFGEEGRRWNNAHIVGFARGGIAV